MATARFTVLSCIDGYDVIDEATGHPVDHRDTLRSANGVAYVLNGATQATPGSRGSLSRAWGTHRPYERPAPTMSLHSLRRERPMDH